MSPQLYRMLGFFAVMYVLFMLLVIVGQPLTQLVFKPLLGQFLPVSKGGDLIKTVGMFTVMFWMLAGGFIAVQLKKNNSAS